jgi:(R,R)-butanediol dehydrogenase/meso-butanediol dehydrogenase/diacetyl reductase
MIVGHEMTGTVIETGRDVADVRDGDRVVLNGCLTCGECRSCTSGAEVQCPSLAGVAFAIDGGLAEQMVWKASQVVRLPDNVSSEEAALVEPSSVAMHAVRRSRLQQGERVVVLGVGTVGMMAMQEAKALGARVFAVDRRQMSLDMAARLGADAVINPEAQDAGEALRDLTDGDGPDVVIDAAGGRDTPALGAQWVRAGGRVLLVAIFTAKTEIDFNSVVGREVEVIGSIAYQRHDVEQVVSMISSGAIRTAPLISDRISLEDVISKGYERMMAPTKDVFKILVAPSGVPGSLGTKPSL